MPSRFLATITLFLSAAQTGTLLAHPGHGTTDPQAVTHYAIEPLHALPWMAAIVGGAILMGIMARRRSQTLHVATTTAPKG